MAENSKIEWTHHTFNPWVGCTKVSPACDHCYAEGWAKRSGMVQWGPHAERRRTSESNWQQPIKWNAEAERLGVRYRVFCSSLADVFDNAVPHEWRNDLFTLIEQTPNLDWLLLTKRIGNAGNMLPVPFDFDRLYPNVWLGATICNQEEADRDIQKLLAVPAAKRFLSMEPLLGPVNLTDVPMPGSGHGHHEFSPIITGNALKRADSSKPKIDWVIVGGESGPGARPMHPEWARSLRDQCAADGVPFLFKQWGEWEVASVANGHHDCDMTRNGAIWLDHDGTTASPSSSGLSDNTYAMLKVGKKKAGRVLDGRLWDEVPV